MLQIKLQRIFKTSALSTHMLWVVYGTCQWMRQWRVIQCCAKRLADAVIDLSQCP